MRTAKGRCATASLAQVSRPCLVASGHRIDKRCGGGRRWSCGWATGAVHAHELIVLPAKHLQVQLRLGVNKVAHRRNLLDASGRRGDLHLQLLGGVNHPYLEAVESYTDLREV